MSTRTRFEKEAKGNSEMVYYNQKTLNITNQLELLEFAFALLPY